MNRKLSLVNKILMFVGCISSIATCAYAELAPRVPRNDEDRLPEKDRCLRSFLPPDFSPSNDRLLISERKGTSTILCWIDARDGDRGGHIPLVADDPVKAEELFRVANGCGNGLGKEIVEFKAQASEFYFRVDAVISRTDFNGKRVADADPLKVSCLILRPTLLERAWTLPSSWLYPSGDTSASMDVIMGSTGRKDLDGFRRAADYLACFMLLGSNMNEKSDTFLVSNGVEGCEGGKLIERTVAELKESFRWVGTIEYQFIEYAGPTVRPGEYQPAILHEKGRRLERIKLVLEMDRNTGVLNISIAPSGHSELFPELRHFSPSKLALEKMQLIHKAEHLAFHKQDFFDGFSPVEKLPKPGPFGVARSLLMATDGRGNLKPTIADDPSDAKAAVERDIAIQSNWPQRSGSKPNPVLPKVTGIKSFPLYHLVDVASIDGEVEQLKTLIILRPALLESITGVWTKPQAVAFLGKAARNDSKLAADALDVLAYLMWTPEKGYVLSRTVDGESLQWVAIAAELPMHLLNIGPQTRADFHFFQISLSADRSTGRLTLEKKPLNVAH